MKIRLSSHTGSLPRARVQDHLSSCRGSEQLRHADRRDDRKRGEKYALVVAIEYKRGMLHLPLTRRDAIITIDTLQKHGYKRENIQLLFDDQATRVTILQALDRLQKASETSSEVTVVMSGHGVQDRDTLGHETDGRCECFVPYQRSGNKVDPRDLIRDAEFANIASRFNSQCAVTWVFDCCHSGTMIDLELVKPAEDSRAAPMVCVSSCRDAQLALAINGVGRLISLLASDVRVDQLHDKQLSNRQHCRVTWLRGTKHRNHPYAPYY